MLLTTSRKPSQRTRSFAQRLARILGWTYINRGKMNLREVLIDAGGPAAILFERHGNPARITFLDERGHELGYILFNASFDLKPVSLRGAARSARSCPDDLHTICRLMGLEHDPSVREGAWDIRPAGDYRGVMELIDSEGRPSGFKLIIKDIRMGE
ncbi:ribosomal biosynthesis protein [Methanothermobacter wolfeii]|uniref:Probable Brix domain-containing ribosomal biogenesis protein n=2 Tax=Methanothermobacter TaxID=145260 RepID=A0A9E7UFR1_METWO|nr:MULTISPECIES: ribosomal biosynthesis protein [Methanothermobacter]ADL58660.1 Imp4-like protein [Methanothermobacter marburgensis str. Marburg]NLM03149.1 ribosomal biosynthesis protein [Methanothermobacter wolfeii]QHN06477.1 ribosomal biosynthesis protein [Methanothermobacter sp. THM-1]QHN07513.1 ribosomal biosynthesis protein [Methanothermobacter sp. THM-2]UXH30979.1 ribosomal biosynthesis protein [Methanothermobacter wolfeii]